MKDFNDAFDALIGNEGGYVNNPADPGGETMWGITKRVAVANKYMGQMKDLPRATAMQIAKKEYWDGINGDQLDPNVAFQVFDAAYNHGIKQASLWLQRAVGVTADGIIGPATVRAANSMLWYQVVFLFLSQRTKFYPTLGTWATFGKGWTNRIGDNLHTAGQAS